MNVSAAYMFGKSDKAFLLFYEFRIAGTFPHFYGRTFPIGCPSGRVRGFAEAPSRWPHSAGRRRATSQVPRTVGSKSLAFEFQTPSELPHATPLTSTWSWPWDDHVPCPLGSNQRPPYRDRDSLRKKSEPVPAQLCAVRLLWLSITSDTVSDVQNFEVEEARSLQPIC